MTLMTKKMIENANKLAYLVQQYPNHKTFGDTLALFQLTNIDLTTAVWVAVELGFISETKNKQVKFLEAPQVWVFGQEQSDLEDMIIYFFNKLAEKETDIEEISLAQWTAGYPSHDLAVTLKKLLETKVLFAYTIDDVDKDGISNKYTFFTLYENKDKVWGKKQFKVEPKSNNKKGKAL